MKSNISITSIRQVITCILCLQMLTATAQQTEKVAFAAAPMSAQKIVDAPKNITASDGLYDRYVLIHWEANTTATHYKVFRTSNIKGGNLQEISHNWQQSTWLCDYNAVPGVPYYYAVVATNGQQNSTTSAFDKGYIKKNDIAHDSSLSTTDKNEKYSTEKLVLLMIDGASTDKKAYTLGETINVSVKLANISDEPTRPTELRFFLSKDATLDWDDKNLSLKTLASVPAGANLAATTAFSLPSNTPSGDNFLIVVSSTGGDVLNSRTSVLKIQVNR